MKVRAKFRCTSVTKVIGWGGHEFLWTAKFQVVTGEGGEENKKYWGATPAGNLELSSIIEDAFEVGKQYYVDIEPAPVKGTSEERPS